MHLLFMSGVIIVGRGRNLDVSLGVFPPLQRLYPMCLSI